MKKDYAVYSLRVANELVRKGFDIIGSGANQKNPKYKVFYFKDTAELREMLNQIAKQ